MTNAEIEQKLIAIKAIIEAPPGTDAQEAEQTKKLFALVMPLAANVLCNLNNIAASLQFIATRG